MLTLQALILAGSAWATYRATGAVRAHRAARRHQAARSAAHPAGHGWARCSCSRAGHPGTDRRGHGECPACSGAGVLPLVGWHQAAQR